MKITRDRGVMGIRMLLVIGQGTNLETLPREPLKEVVGGSLPAGGRDRLAVGHLPFVTSRRTQSFVGRMVVS